MLSTNNSLLLTVKAREKNTAEAGRFGKRSEESDRLGQFHIRVPSGRHGIQRELMEQPPYSFEMEEEQ